MSLTGIHGGAEPKAYQEYVELGLARSDEELEDVSFRKVAHSLPASKVLSLEAEAFGVSEGELTVSRKRSLVRPGYEPGTRVTNKPGT